MPSTPMLILSQKSLNCGHWTILKILFTSRLFRCTKDIQDFNFLNRQCLVVVVLSIQITATLYFSIKLTVIPFNLYTCIHFETSKKCINFFCWTFCLFFFYYNHSMQIAGGIIGKGGQNIKRLRQEVCKSVSYDKLRHITW